MQKSILEALKDAEKHATARREAQARLRGLRGEIGRAVLMAHQELEASELLPNLEDNGEYRYSISQGLRAAAHAREDVAVTLILQHAVLRRLARIEAIALLCLSLMLYVAWRVS